MNDINNALPWLQFIGMFVGFITILLKIGNKQGQQDEKNKHFEETQKEHSSKIEKIEKDISDIKTDVSFIRGKLEV